jgi:hypothetical protein
LIVHCSENAPRFADQHLTIAISILFLLSNIGTGLEQPQFGFPPPRTMLGQAIPTNSHQKSRDSTISPKAVLAG